MIGLEYPGGPKIEAMAKNGNENRFKFTKPLIDAVGKGKNKENLYNFSFSGLKTAVRREIEKLTNMNYDYDLSHTKLSQQDICDISASFQKTIVDILKDRFKNVANYLNESAIKLNKMIFAGGVSANNGLRQAFKDHAAKYGWKIFIPKFSYTTDNAAMIAIAGYFKYLDKQFCPMEAPAYSRVSL